MAEEGWLDARAAAGFLGVKEATLYAYVSRGLLHSTPGERGPARRYPRKALVRLRASRDARTSPAARALRWGEPVLDSSITRLDPSGPAYRGRSAVELSELDTPFESVAELLWTGSLPERPPVWQPRDGVLPQGRLLSPLLRGSPPLTVLSALVPLWAAADSGRFDTGTEAILPRARSLVAGLAVALALNPARAERARRARSVARAVALALGARGGRDAVTALNRTLVLLADHELNASAFAARVAASTEAHLYACVSAALATLAGPLHGAASERVEALVAEIARPERASHVLHERMRRGEPIPGFGHPLYPDGDPRATSLFRMALEIAPHDPTVLTLRALVDAMQEAGRPAPNVDAGLVALTAALRLPPGSGPGLFAVGRSVGWIAHVLEQYSEGYVVRPRARYFEADPG